MKFDSMPTDHRAELKRIRDFRSLVRYLRDEMDWPIDSDDFEELAFDFTPEELGIDPRSAAGIKEIKRLRPLTTGQPWGIFFVNFEKKKLPVVALRRILSSVTLKKRASANNDERAAWSSDDLLFISNYGESDSRQISFAHFSQHPEKEDLPTLKVLGWNDKDTLLHLDKVAETLIDCLAWPPDEDNHAQWRDKWRSCFILRHREVIETSRVLAIRLAELAGKIRNRINTVLAIENERGPITKLMNALQTSLIHDLSKDDFADMYAQTIAYGLLSARITDPNKQTADEFGAHLRTSPFLRELMEAFLHIGGRRGRTGGMGIDFDELGVSEVVELLDSANMEAVIRDFGDKNPEEDPVIHFYELFLKEYDSEKRMKRGVFATPRPVVSYIVRSVDELLRTEFGLPDGLADTTTWGEMLKKKPGLKLPPLTDEPGEKRTISPDEPFVQILDPATGTATFLVEVIDVIRRTLLDKWKRLRLTEAQQLAAWNDYVPQHLLPRLYAYEIMMAPYAIAHMKVGLKLVETGYRFGTEERARIYLTNALEPWVKQLPLIGLDALAHETAAVNEIKRHKRFTVVIGNPPYSNFGQLNKIPFILNLLDDYKRGLNEKKINLDDDFIKFLRYGQYLLKNTDTGILGFITNNVYLEGLTHRQMRKSLLDDFRNLQVLNLHGDLRKKETAPDGSPDENVFLNIMQGVAVAIATREIDNTPMTRVLFSDLWGTRNEKYKRLLLGKLTGNAIDPKQPNYFFKSNTNTESVIEQEYSAWWRLSDCSEGISGIETKRDHFAIDQDRVVLEGRVREFVDGRFTDDQRKEKFLIRDNEWVVEDAVKALQKDRSWEKRFVPCLHRPFDSAWIIYSGVILARDRGPLMAGMIRPNVGLIAARQSKEPFAVLATNCVCTHKIVTVYDRSFIFPLYAYASDTQLGVGLESFAGRRANYSPKFTQEICRLIGLKWISDGKGDLHTSVGPEDIFNYAYAVFHSPAYRTRYAEFLKIDFPRLPLTSQLELFHALAALGGNLVALHLLESPKLDKTITKFIGDPRQEIEKVTYADKTVWIDKVQTTGFKGVPDNVWNFHIGGYQVCEKWLKDRKGRTLSKKDIVHYQKVVVALKETIRIMKKIDEVIDKHGGWPGAFSTEIK